MQSNTYGLQKRKQSKASCVDAVVLEAWNKPAAWWKCATGSVLGEAKAELGTPPILHCRQQYISGMACERTNLGE